MSKIERLIDLQQRLSGNYPATILLFKAGAFAQAFNEDALLLHKELGFKLVLLGSDKPYLRVGFPFNRSEQQARCFQDKLRLNLTMVERDAAGLVKDSQSFGEIFYDPMLKNALINNTKVNDAIQAEIKKRDLSATNVIATAKLVDRVFLPRYKVSQFVLLLMKAIDGDFLTKFGFRLDDVIGELAIELTVVANRYPMATNEEKISALRALIWKTNTITDLLNMSIHVSSLSSFEKGGHCIRYAQKMNATFTAQLASLQLALT
jgi:hypothetical protein